MLKKLMIIMMLIIIPSVLAINTPEGCSKSDSDYLLTDTFTDTNGVDIKDHAPDYNDTSEITSDAWITSGSSAQIQDNVAYGNTDGDNFAIDFNGVTGNDTISVWIKSLANTGSASISFHGSPTNKVTCQAWFQQTTFRAYEFNYGFTAFDGILSTGKWFRYEITHDEVNSKCNYRVYDNDNVLLINHTAADRVDPLANGDATRLSVNLLSADTETGHADNLTFYRGGTCPSSDEKMSLNVTNWTRNMIDYDFGGTFNNTGTCTLNGNWTGAVAKNETKAVTANTAFNFTTISFAPSQSYSWYVNCSNATVNTETSSTYSFNTNTIPTVSSVNIQPSGAESVDDLTCNYTYADTESHLEDSNFVRWYRNGTINATGNTLPSSNTTTGDLWSCDVIVNDGGSNSTVGTSSNLTLGDNTLPVMNNFAPEVVATYTTSGQVNVTVNCTDSGSSIDTVYYISNISGNAVNNSMSLTTDSTYQDTFLPTTVGTYTLEEFGCKDTSGNWVTYNGDNITIPTFQSSNPGGVGGGASAGGGGRSQKVDVGAEILALTCGNSICDLNENVVNCQSDCKLNLDTIICFDTEDPNCVATQFLVPNVLLSFLAVLGLVFIIRTQVIKK